MKEIISTKKAPAAIGPYSQAVKVGGLLFVSGQIPLVPETGEIVAGGIKEQTARVLDSLKAIVEAAGGSLDDVVKTSVSLDDIKDFGAMNEVYAEYFKKDAPARVCVEVGNLPKGALVEIDVIVSID